MILILNLKPQNKNLKLKVMKKLQSSLVVTVLAIAGSVAFFGCAAAHHDHSEHSHGAAHSKPYPLKTCLVTGETFDHGKPYTFVHEGQEIQLCCKDCLTDFNKEPAKYLSKLKETK